MSTASANVKRGGELWAKWKRQERFTDDERQEALRHWVGLYGRPPAEGTADHARFLAVWDKCARFELDQLTAEDLSDAGRFCISVPWPEPSPEEVALNDRRTMLLGKRVRGEPWTREDGEEAVACGAASRERVEAYFAFIDAVRARGLEPVLDGGLDCQAVHLRNLPRTPEGGYVLPSLLDDITYQDRLMDFVDVDAPQGRRLAMWVGVHRQTGTIVAFTEVPTRAQLDEYWLEWSR